MRHFIQYAGWFIIAVVLILVGLADATFDLPALNAQVQVHEAKIENHEARITNNEKDIETLQSNTNTPPAPDKVIVQQAPASETTQPAPVAPEPTPTPTPIPQTTPYGTNPYIGEPVIVPN